MQDIKKQFFNYFGIVQMRCTINCWIYWCNGNKKQGYCQYQKKEPVRPIQRHFNLHSFYLYATRLNLTPGQISKIIHYPNKSNDNLWSNLIPVLI